VLTELRANAKARLDHPAKADFLAKLAQHTLPRGLPEPEEASGQRPAILRQAAVSSYQQNPVVAQAQRLDLAPGAHQVRKVIGRRVAHAGAAGNERAVIYAERILSPQLRIAGALAMGDPDAAEAVRKTPEMAVLQDGQIVVKPWSA